MASPARHRESLRLIAGGAGSLPEPTGRSGWAGPPPAARPTDRCEPWPLDSRTIGPLTRAAADLGIAFQLAAVVTVERSLVAEDLRALCATDAAQILDIAARSTTVTGELSEPTRAYLAALDRGTSVLPHAPSVLVLPMRLTERLGSIPPASRLDAMLLTSAIAWERAAVVTGRTMTEWSLMQLAGGAA